MIKTYRGIIPEIHETAFIAENAVIIGDVDIGEESSVWYNCVIHGDVNFIKIGARTNIQDGTIIHVSSDTHPTVLEDQITVGHNAVIHGCRIETGSLIGIGATILDGAHIGRYSLVAAGSLVTPDTQIPPNSFVIGTPAKIKRQLTAGEIKNLDRFWQNYTKILPFYKQ